MAIDKEGNEVKAGRIADVQEVHNLDKKFGANSTYFAIRLQFESGEEKTGLFTEAQIREAIERAEKNPEDVPAVGKLRNFLD